MCLVLYEENNLRFRIQVISDKFCLDKYTNFLE